MTNGNPEESKSSGCPYCCSVDLQGIIGIAKDVLLNPKGCWEQLKARQETIADIYKNFLIPIMVVVTICSFIGKTFVGISVPFVGTWKAPFMSALGGSIVFFVLQLAGIYVAAMVLEYIAKKFDVTVSRVDAFKLMSYALVPSYLAGMLMIIPALGILGFILGIYALYVYYCGIPVMLGIPQDRQMSFFWISFIAFVVIGVVFSLVVGIFMPKPSIDLSAIKIPQVLK